MILDVNIFVWCILLVIGVSDAKAHRIPNKLLILLLLTLCLGILTQKPTEALLSVFVDKSIAFGITFFVGLVLYFLRVLAPGDVKLIAVLGFYLGTGCLVNYVYYVCITITFVGPMYWLMNRLHLALKNGANRGVQGQANGMSLTGVAVCLELSRQQLKRNITTEHNLAYMPFAPILIIGLALQHYYY